MKAPKYNIGDKVYHITPESESGVILDASYSLLNDRWQYRVTFGIKDNDYWYEESELSANKIFG
jgi:hypothetical protein